MRLKQHAIIVTFFLIFSLATFGQTGTPTINVVTTAVPFLRIGPDARAGAMGDLGLTTAPDANNMYWNLAKTPFSEQSGGIALNYTPWLKDLGVNDVYMVAASGFFKLDEESALSGSFRYFNMGDIQFTDFFGNPLSTGKPTEMAIDIGYSRKLSETWGVGAALRYINSNLTRGMPSQSGVVYQAGNTVAGDLSLFYDGTSELGKGVRFGFALTNLGGKVSYTNIESEKEYIPANMGFGFSYNTAFDEQNKLMLGLDINKLLVPTPPIITGDSATDAQALFDYRNQSVVTSWFSSFSDAPGGFSEELKEFTFSVGAEYSYQDQFFVRAGYYYEHPTKGNRKYATAGFGLKLNTFGIDFSYLIPSGSGTNRNPLSNTLRFGLTFDFDRIN